MSQWLRTRRPRSRFFTVFTDDWTAAQSAKASLAVLSPSTKRKLVTESRSLLPALAPSETHRPSEGKFITPSQFNREHLAAKRPAYFPSLVSHASSPHAWPACREWPADPAESGQGPLHGLERNVELHDQVVDVEVAAWGRGYGDGVKQETLQRRDGSLFRKEEESPTEEQAMISAWSKVQLPLPLFFDLFINGKYPQQGGLSLVGYLAQQNLFEKSSELQRQCPPLPHALAGDRGAREQWRRNLWIGGQGTFTPIHCDPYENLFVQVVGRKRVHIFPPSTRPDLYLFDATRSMQTNTSSIPTEAPLLDASESQAESAQFPRFKERVMTDKDASHVIMAPGDCLYIPVGWYHCVSSLSVSASVNAWFR